MRRSARIAALNATSNSTKPNRKRKAEKVSTIFPTKHLHFKEPFCRQNWLFRDSLINYITKNPSNSKAWQKLIQSCKYFFAKNPVFVFDKLEYKSKKWMVSLNETKKRIDFTKILIKLWITDKFNASNGPQKSVLSIIPKLYKCDAKYLSLMNDVIPYKDFLFLSSNLEQIVFHNIIVKNENDEIIPFEKLFAVLPKIKECYFYNNLTCSSITTNTVKELLKMPHFSKINRDLYYIPEEFDIETFFRYLRKNKHSTFYLRFRSGISETYKNRLEAIVDEILSIENHDYKIPNIYFIDLPNEKWKKLHTIFFSQN
uniref:Uncharacterized protein n=1 Tax=Panagrolaimus davidi TaxID=227884 RepID=A0A914Q860_9BILA